MPRINHQVIKMPINAEMPINQAPRCRMLRWLGDRAALPGPFEVDRDNDNRIGLAELQGRIAAIFARMDRDGNGVLTRAELLTIRSMPGDGRAGRRGR